jgi:DNA-binding NarL/FixJ family response regulator
MRSFFRARVIYLWSIGETALSARSHGDQMTAWARPRHSHDSIGTNFVRTEDARAIVRLAGEVCEIKNAKEDPTTHLLRSLSAITRSEVAIAFAACVRAGEAYQVSRAIDFGWQSQRDRARVFDYCLSLKLSDDVLVSEAMRRAAPVSTVVRSEVMLNREWHRTVLYNEVYVPSGIEDSLVSVLKMNDQGDIRTLIFKRSPKSGAYSARERDLLDIFLSECRWLYSQPISAAVPIAAARLEKFSRREREVLEILLTGAPEKHVASLLGVSRNTAHQYVKSIYRKLSVTSRPQLMAEMAEAAKTA